MHVLVLNCSALDVGWEPVGCPAYLKELLGAINILLVYRTLWTLCQINDIQLRL